MDKFVDQDNQYDFLVLRHWLHTITEDYWSGYDNRLIKIKMKMFEKKKRI